MLQPSSIVVAHRPSPSADMAVWAARPLGWGSMRLSSLAARTVKSWGGPADHVDVTSGEFDFFGAPTTPPPSAPPVGAPVNRFGLPPAVNQFGTPAATNQFGMPASAPAPVLLPPVKDQTGRN